jgi:starch synthase
VKVLVLSEYPAPAAGLALQGELLCRGLSEMGVDVHPVHLKSDLEKEWYYRWFKPDVVVGVGFWGHIPNLVLHPQQFGMKAVPWLVADGYIAEHRDVLNALPLILVTSNWVKEVYVRDGIREMNSWRSWATKNCCRRLFIRFDVALRSGGRVATSAQATRQGLC